MSITKPTVALTGASGGIGQALLPRLAEIFCVKALFRATSRGVPFARDLGCQIVVGNLEQKRAVEELVCGAEIVIHCAASVTRALGHAHVTNVEGTRRLAELAVSAGCRRFVHVSSIAVYL